MLKTALKVFTQLTKTNHLALDPIASIQTNLGLLYNDTQRFSESEAMFKAALDTYKQLTMTNSQIYKERVADCYYWFGRTLLSKESYHEAIELFLQSLDLGKEMIQAGDNIDIYSKSLYALILSFSNEKDYISAYKYNEELLPILTDLYEKDDAKWKSTYAQALTRKAYHANLFGKFQEGEQSSLEALKIDSTAHIAYTNLAAAMLFQGKTEEAEKLYRQYKGEFKDGMLDDFAEFERLRIIPKERKSDVERIKAILKE